MPQLRESGSAPSGENSSSAHLNDFARIFGLETEFGVAVTGAKSAVDASEVAMAMFRSVVASSRSTNTYLTNGSRLYLDVGSHPEYATAEATDPRDALALDLAGERVMRDLGLAAQNQVRTMHGESATIHVFKNNVDSAGHAFGCHENYLVRRFVPLEAIEQQLLPFLITRQLFTGAGRVSADGFQMTQRADFLDEAVSSATTQSRPMVNTRDEPHADPDSFRRLHVIIGDSNRAQWATFMKLATTHLVLCVIEDAFRNGSASGFEKFALAEPAAANRTVSRFLDNPQAPLALANGQTITALALQRRYLECVIEFARTHAQELAASLTHSKVDDIIAQWSSALDALESGNYTTLADKVDWAAKYRLFAALKARHANIAVSALEQLELDYHDVANGKTFASLTQHNRMASLVSENQVLQALSEPPSDTRAALRGRFIQQASAADARFSCDWTHLTLSDPVRSEITLMDPFGSAPSDDFNRLLGQLKA